MRQISFEFTEFVAAGGAALQKLARFILTLLIVLLRLAIALMEIARTWLDKGCPMPTWFIPGMTAQAEGDEARFV
jgi:hypothetical protein